jgi:magnesium-transporting ATPase (P-type)
MCAATESEYDDLDWISCMAKPITMDVSRRWFNMPARELVPGDLIEIKIGDVIPADSILLPGMAVEVSPYPVCLRM